MTIEYVVYLTFRLQLKRMYCDLFKENTTCWKLLDHKVKLMI